MTRRFFITSATWERLLPLGKGVWKRLGGVKGLTWKDTAQSGSRFMWSETPQMEGVPCFQAGVGRGRGNSPLSGHAKEPVLGQWVTGAPESGRALAAPPCPGPSVVSEITGGVGAGEPPTSCPLHPEASLCPHSPHDLGECPGSRPFAPSEPPRLWKRVSGVGQLLPGLSQLLSGPRIHVPPAHQPIGGIPWTQSGHTSRLWPRGEEELWAWRPRPHK